MLQISPQSTEVRSAGAPSPSGTPKKPTSASFAKLLANLVSGKKSAAPEKNAAAPEEALARGSRELDPTRTMKAENPVQGAEARKRSPKAGTRLDGADAATAESAGSPIGGPKTAAAKRRVQVSAAGSAEAASAAGEASAAAEAAANGAAGVAFQKGIQKSIRENGLGISGESDKDSKAVQDQGKRRSAKAQSVDRDSLSADPGGGASALLAQLGGAKPQALPPKAQADSGKDGEQVEPVEGKKREKRKERLEIEVHDQRTRPPMENQAPAQDARALRETEMVLELSPDSSGDTAKDAPRTEPKAQSFQDALARELRESANADIVRHASLVLKDGGEGLVRLSLKPESLGSVKVRLEMADNRIAGTIIVETEEALRAFEKEIRSLEQAFVDGGFDGAGLEVSVSADGGGRDGRSAGGNAEGVPFYSQRRETAAASSAVYGAAAPAYGDGVATVDMLA